MRENKHPGSLDFFQSKSHVTCEEIDPTASLQNTEGAMNHPASMHGTNTWLVLIEGREDGQKQVAICTEAATAHQRNQGREAQKAQG
jgi:hypothetical protein